MHRRTFLQTAGAGTAVAIAGCSGDGDSPEAANDFGYETITQDGVDVPLVPLEDAIEWFHEDDDTVFVDTRDETGYQRAHIAGAVFSPASDGLDEDDPLEELSADTRLVTYCVCPHTLATLRGASVIQDGYVHTYAINEGFEPWVEAGYPVEGQAVGSRPELYEIEGRTDSAYADDLAWARHDATGQREATSIAPDGTFTLHLRFHDLNLESSIRLETPAAKLTGSLGSFVDSVVEL